ncbi:putative bifunctional diguanylate cyclase/phosphodiesterase [Actinoplanes friuliensis]|uniref:Protein gmr n=1 Tax=Actinoplanes friuliensis DSM 7358 TaxID=1246995 RepID=U5VY91_9ACTN|nr:bifunctional diguanylate cyclase/phosphodiesterase [Actinoplanes friuliensis]AGZ41747.1 Protein gmr [Actinoplanes friuliensis DSM 7358]
MRHAWRRLLIGGLPVVLAAPWLGEAGEQLAYALVAAAAVVAVVAGVRAYRPARPWSWWLLAAGPAAGGLSCLVWGIGFLAGADLTDVPVLTIVYLAMYLFFAAGIVAVTPAGQGSALSGLAEAGIAACTAAVVVWVFLLDPFVNDRGGWASGGEIVVYPLVDLLVLAAAVRLVVSAGVRTRSHTFLLLAAAALVSADVVYFLSVVAGGSWSGTGVSVAGWLLFHLLTGAAAVHPSMADAPGSRRSSAGRWTTGVYLVVVLVGPAITAYAFLKDLREGEFDAGDIVVPLTATAIIAVLLVIRLSHAGALVARRATELQVALEEQAALQRRMSHLALHDALTGLPNRLSLEQRIDAAVRDGEPATLLMLDLDGFKHVNDSFGHPVGDALLSGVASRLRTSLDERVLVARLGGDEFAVLLTEDDQSGVTESCGTVLDALRRPVEVRDHRLYVTASIGVRRLDPGATASEALSDADMALHAAKAAGKDRAVSYDTRLRDQQQTRIAVVERLRGALGTDEFAVHYQPILSFGTGGFDAVEALVRWRPPGEAPIFPDSFIPAAEDSGLIVRLGEWVLRRACRDAAVWHERHGTKVTVNVSPRQLREPDFAAKVARALRDTGLPAPALILEITEGVLVSTGDHASQSLAHLTELRAAGVGVAVDDFGTGYSSLAYLRDLPIDILKIDKSFLPVGEDAEAGQRTALVRTIVGMAHDLGLTTVAEGVETPEQAALLISLGCDKGQGYLYARPAPAAETDQLLSVLPAARLRTFS